MGGGHVTCVSCDACPFLGYISDIIRSVQGRVGKEQLNVRYLQTANDYVWWRDRIPPAALRVVGSDRKGSLESERVKYGHEYHGTRTRK
jgi:hypothetical protein